MKLLLQRVKQAKVSVEGKTIASIGEGLLVFAGFGKEDSAKKPDTKAWDAMLKKTVELRIFPDEANRFNMGLADYGGEILLVSQFTLYADCRKGRRPAFDAAAPPELARGLFDKLVADMEALLPGKVGQGEFGAMMDVTLTNWGPVTIMLSSDMFRRG